MNILQEAEKAVYGDREADYGSVLENFTTVAKLWSVVAKVELTPEQVGLMMVQLKVARQMNKAKRDNLVDGAGYFATLEKMEEERKVTAGKSKIDSIKYPREEEVIFSDISQEWLNALYHKKAILTINTEGTREKIIDVNYHPSGTIRKLSLKKEDINYTITEKDKKPCVISYNEAYWLERHFDNLYRIKNNGN